MKGVDNFLLGLFLIGMVVYESDKNASKDIFSSEDILTKLGTQQLKQVKLSDGDIESMPEKHSCVAVLLFFK